MSDTTPTSAPGAPQRLSSREYWDIVNTQLDELRTATSADQVLAILSPQRSPLPADTSSAPGFFAGSGGDRSVLESLDWAGWRTIWSQSPVYYVMRAPDGSAITYVEGDLYNGDYSAAARS